MLKDNCPDFSTCAYPHVRLKGITIFMELKEVIAKKKQLEKDIRELILNFKKEVDINSDSISIEYVTEQADGLCSIAWVNVKLVL